MGRKEETLKGWRDFKREVEEGNKVLFLLKSPLSQHHDTICIRQRCPEPTCDICKKESEIAEINQLRYPEVLEECTQKQDGIKNMTLATSSHSKDEQAYISVNMPKTHLSGYTASQHTDANRLSFIAFNIQEHLEKHLKKKASFQMLDKEKDTRLIYHQIWTECTEASSDKSLKSHDVQGSGDCRTDCNSESKPEQMSTSQQLLYIESFKDNMQQKSSQLFWGLPSLHSESLVATVLVPGRNPPLDTPFVYFNGICNAPMVQKRDQGYTPIPYYQPLPLSKVYPDPFASPKYQAQNLHFPHPHVQPQTHLQSEFPILPSSFLPQTRNSGVSFHRGQNEPDSHITSDNKNLERNVLQRQQERLWSLVPGFKKPQGIIYPQTSSIPLVNQSSKVYVPVSLLNGHFHITNESQPNFTPYLPGRFISPWCLHTYRNPDSQAVMDPKCTAVETAQYNARHPYSQFSELRGQNNKDLTNMGWDLLGRIPMKPQLQNDSRRNLCYILGKSPEDSPRRISGCYVKETLGTGSETTDNCMYHTRSHSGNGLLNVFRKDIGSNHVKTILRLHLSRKFWQMTMGRIPICVCRSWLGDGSTLPSGSPQINTGNTKPGNTMGDGAYCQITTSEPSFLDSNTRQMLESHIIRFRASQRWGIPLKAVKSIKLYMTREAKTWPLPQFEVPSSASQVSRLVSKAEASKPLEKYSETFQENQIRTTNSISSLDCSIPVPSSEDHEGWEALKSSPSDANNEFAIDFQEMNIDGQTILSVTQSNIDKVIEREMDHSCEVEVPIMPNGTDEETMDKNVWFCDNVEVIQEQNTVNNNLEHMLTSNVSREIFKAEELWCPQSRSSDSLISTESQSSQIINLNENKVQNTITTEALTPETEVYENAKPFDNKRQVVNNLKLKSKEQKEAKKLPHDTSDTSTSSQSSLMHVQSTSCSDIRSSQFSYVQLLDIGIRPEKRQQLRVPKHNPWKCHDGNYQPDTRIDFQAGKHKHEGSGEETYTIEKSHQFTEDRILKDTSPSLSQNKQCQGNIQFPQNYLRKKMRQFFQWLDNKRQNFGQEQLLQKFKFTSLFVHHQNPLESGSTFMNCESPEGIELMTTIGDMLEEKLAQVHKSKSSVLHHQAQVDNRQHPSTDAVLSDPQQRAREAIKPCNHETVSVGQSCLRYVQQVLDKYRLPSTVVTLEGQTPCQNQDPSLPLRRLTHLQNPSSSHQACPNPPVALSHDENSVLNDLKLLFQQKALLQRFKQGDTSQ